MFKPKKREPLHVPYVATVTFTFSGIIKGDGVLTVSPKMLIDKSEAPLDEALAHNQIRNLKVEYNVNRLEEAKEMVKESEEEY